MAKKSNNSPNKGSNKGNSGNGKSSNIGERKEDFKKIEKGAEIPPRPPKKGDKK